MRGEGVVLFSSMDISVAEVDKEASVEASRRFMSENSP
jgi:hypothetical protein